MQMRSYEAARNYFSVLGFISWCVIVLGAIVAIAALGAVGQMSRNFGGSPMAGVAGLIPGVAIMFLGFLGLVFVQIGRAGVDSAEYGQQSLKIAREQLEISKQALLQGAASEMAPPGLRATGKDFQSGRSNPGPGSRTEGVTSTEPEDLDQKEFSGADRIIEYRGHKISKFGHVFKVRQEVFVSLESAQAAVDRELAQRRSDSPAGNGI